MLENIINEATEKLASELADYVEKVKASVKEGIETAKVWIEETGKKISNWYVTITSPKHSATATSQNVAVYAVYGNGDDTWVEQVTTVGAPYMIAVQNENGDYQETLPEALKVTITYDNKDLVTAGVTSEMAISQISVFRFDEEQQAYIRQDGTLDTVKKAVTFLMAEPGEYVLGIDTTAPVISDIRLSNTGTTPTIYAYVGDITGIKELTMKLDGKEVVSESNFKTYLKRNDFAYAVLENEPLSIGKHSVSFMAEDTSGNRSDEVTHEFEVNDNESVPEPDDDTKSDLVVKQKIDMKNYFGETYQKYAVSPKANATINNKGILTAKKPGKITVSAYKKNGKKWIETKKVELVVGLPSYKQKTVEATYQGQLIDIASLFDRDGLKPDSWDSSNKKVSIVNENGIATVVGQGTSKISAVYGSGKNAIKYPITLKVSYPKMSKEKATLQTGSVLKLKLNNTKKTVTWTTSNKSLATVDAGTIKALKAGTVRITATVDGKNYTSNITISAPAIKKDNLSVKVGKTVTVGLKNTKLKNIVWNTSDESIAVVDSKGKVKGVSAGTATIYTTAGGITNSCVVTVTGSR